MVNIETGIRSKYFDDFLEFAVEHNLNITYRSDMGNYVHVTFDCDSTQLPEVTKYLDKLDNDWYENAAWYEKVLDFILP